MIASVKCFLAGWLLVTGYFNNWARAQQEVLAMATISQCDKCLGTGFDLVELYACTNISDLTQYSFAIANVGAATKTTYVFTPGFSNFANISSGTKIYATSFISSANLTKFFSGYDFSGSIVVSAGKQALFGYQFKGNENFQLLYGGSDVVDSYGLFAVDHTNQKPDIQNGWSKRKAGTSASSNFNVSDWVLTPGAFLNQPQVNGEATTPLTLGTYVCGPPPAMTSAPHPTSAGRISPRDPTPDHNRPPHDPPPAPTTSAPVVAPTLAPTPAPVKIPNPRRPRPTRNRRHRGPSQPSG